jgi:FkbM family methyltransferase
LTLSFRVAYEYILSLQTVRYGYTAPDKLKILLNRLLYGSFPLNLLWHASFKRPLIEPRKFLNDYRCRYGDLVLCCPGGNSEIQFLDSYEPTVKNMISRLKGGDAVDVGANMGLYTLMLSRVLGERGKVLSIEADPYYFQLLKRNIELNSGYNVASLNVAAWSHYEDLELTRHPFGSSPIDTSVSPASGVSTHRVKGRPLDDILSELEINPGLVKIDVEGAEYQVLLGMGRTLQSARPFIIFEAISPFALKKCSALLFSSNYAVRPLHDGNFLATPGSGGILEFDLFKRID